MPKIAMIGAGSVVFANNILGDLLTYPELKDNLHLSLMDIDPERLKASEGYARQRLKKEGSGSCLKATMDLGESLDNSDYVINMIQVGGLDATLLDFNIPAKYGLKQTIADTHGIGGIFRALRTIPRVLEICREMEKRCPEAWLINYSNPMAMNTWAAYRSSPVKVLGLCHSVQLTAAMLANYIEIPFPELRYRAAGINHICWFLKLKHRGENLYPLLFEAMKDPQVYSSDPVRFEIMKNFGCFVSESSEHMAEYVPYFIPRENLIEKLKIPINEYIRRCQEQEKEFEINKEVAEGKREIPKHFRSFEYAAPLIHSIETNQTISIYGNIENTGIISNLPAGCCVEAPCLVDGNGVQPIYVGELPPQLSAINRNHIGVQELTVKAVLENKPEYIYYACQLDPLASAMLTLEDINSLANELWQAHAGYLEYLVTKSK